MVNNKLYKYITQITAFIIICLLSSCANNEDSAGIANIKFEVSNSDFNQNSNPESSDNISKNNQEIFVPFEQDKILAISIKPIDNSSQISLAKKSSHTIEHNSLYKLLVFNANKKLVINREFNIKNAIIPLDSLNTNDTYSFIIYTLGSDVLPELNISLGSNRDEVALYLSSITDLMVCSLYNIKLQKGENNIKSELKHLFSKVKITLKTANVGNIVDLGSVYLDSIYKKATIDFTEDPKSANYIKFSDMQLTYNLNTLTQQGSDKTTFSNSGQIIFVDGKREQSLTFSRINLTGGAPRVNQVIPGLKLKPGNSYDIVVSIKKIENKVVQFGDQTWSTGNLKTLSNDLYDFESSQGDHGDHFYRDNTGKYYDKPAVKGDNGVAKGTLNVDLCKKIGNNEWRTPTQADITKLEQLANWYGNPSNKFEGTYKNSANVLVRGVYFGTNSQPTEANQDKFLFLPLAGAYNSGNLSQTNDTGFYWFTGSNVGASFQFSKYYLSISSNGGSDPKRANSIRCIKEK